MTHRVINTVIYMEQEDRLQDAVLNQIKEAGIEVISVSDLFHANLDFYLHQPEVALFAVGVEDENMIGFDFVVKLVRADALKPSEVALISGDFEVEALAVAHEFHFFDKGDGGFVEEMIGVAQENAIAKRKGSRVSASVSVTA